MAEKVAVVLNVTLLHKAIYENKSQQHGNSLTKLIKRGLH